MTKSNSNPTSSKLRIGSRGSQLALWQANHISALLRARGHEVEIEIIHTTGDKITDVALAKVGTKGMFTKEIEEALAARRNSKPSARISTFIPCVATSIHACASSNKGTTTPSSLPPLG